MACHDYDCGWDLVSGDVHDAALYGDDDGLRAVFHREFLQKAGDVYADGIFRDGQFGRDLAIAVAFGEQAQTSSSRSVNWSAGPRAAIKARSAAARTCARRVRSRLPV